MRIGNFRLLQPQGTLRRNSIQFIHFQAFHFHPRSHSSCSSFAQQLFQDVNLVLFV